MAAAAAASEKLFLLETISKLKKALVRAPDASDSEESDIAVNTNRGQKLKRKARQVNQGHLNQPAGPKIYLEDIEYAGRKRRILYRKKIHRDFDNSESEPEHDPLEVEEDDPYSGIKLEELLAPATTPHQITTHPALSLPYKSKTLTDLSQQALDIICSEHQHMSILKQLLSHLVGDDPFATLDKMEEVQEPEYIQKARVEQEAIETREREEEEARKKEEEERERAEAERSANADATDKDIEMADIEAPAAAPTNGTSLAPETNGHLAPAMARTASGASILKTERNSPLSSLRSGSMSPPPQHRMTTRSALNPASARPPSPTPPPASPTPLEIIESTDPLYYPPLRSLSARSFGLPALEADETRQLLLAAVQKEEEFIRGLQKVRADLLKADRLRARVWEYCRADGQEEMSDGEDWYDEERWGLDPGELKKGIEEEEEEDISRKKPIRGARR